MRYLITGHTGFKGSWLSLMLKELGHEVSGISLDPERESLFSQARLEDVFTHDIRSDIRDLNSLKSHFSTINPHVVIHLAAQPLVRHSYLHPLETFDSNLMGTLNVLEASKTLGELSATLIITTDKVYKNFGHLRGYLETDQLGGDDPYSASKAAADIATQSWIKSFGNHPIAIARAGNVIGGGDWAADRLIPDLVKSFVRGESAVVRNPNSVRPWQHVLDCLNGYLSLVDSMILNGTTGEWNFGPDHKQKHSVQEVIAEFAKHFNLNVEPWQLDAHVNPAESNLLLLDSTKARDQLHWKDYLDFATSLSWSANWYQAPVSQAREITVKQIKDFFNLSLSVKI
jgi:CDP-glucose 4,6-dehydratase